MAQHLPNELPELTDDERAALDSIPDDAVAHWWNGEKWDFEKEIWIPFHVTDLTRPPE